MTGLCPECGSEAPGAAAPGIHPWTLCTVCGRAWGAPPEPDGEQVGWWVENLGPAGWTVFQKTGEAPEVAAEGGFLTYHEAMLFLEKWLAALVILLPAPGSYNE